MAIAVRCRGRIADLAECWEPPGSYLPPHRNAVFVGREPDLRARMGDSGRALIRDSMSWDSVAERFEAVYERVTRGQIPRA